MTPSELRTNLKTELERWFRIDEWSLGLPAEIEDFDHPTSVGREKPITEFVLFSRPLGGLDNNQSLCTQSLNFQVLYRLSKVWKYEEILEKYRSPMEDQLQAFCQVLNHSPSRIGVNTLATTAKMSCPELRSGDWLLSLSVDVNATYETKAHCNPTHVL